MSDTKYQTFQLNAYTIAGYMADDDSESMPIELHMAHNEETAVRAYRTMHPGARQVHVSTMGTQYCHILESTLLEHDLRLLQPLADALGHQIEVRHRRIEEIRRKDDALVEEEPLKAAAAKA